MSEKAPGFEEYTPSRLEWLTTLLNSYVHFSNSNVGTTFANVNYIYLPGSDGKTIIGYVKHLSSMDEELVKELGNKAKELAIHMAASYKWDSWLNVEIKFEPVDG